MSKVPNPKMPRIPFGDPFMPGFTPNKYGLWVRTVEGVYHLYNESQYMILTQKAWDTSKKVQIQRKLEKRHYTFCGAYVKDDITPKSIGLCFISKKFKVCPKCKRAIMRELKANGEWKKLKDSWKAMKVENKAKYVTEEKKLLDTGEKPWYDM